MSYQILIILPRELAGQPDDMAARAEAMLLQYEADAGLAHEGLKDGLAGAAWSGLMRELPPRATYEVVIKPDGTWDAAEYLASLLEPYADYPAVVVAR